MKYYKLAPILAVLAALWLPTGASASALNVTSEPSVTRALSVARDYWRATSPNDTTSCAGVEVWVEELANTEVEGKIVSPSAITQIGSCRMTVSPEFWQYRTGRSDREAMLCLLITHEYGHVLGLGDVLTGGSIMSLEPPLALVPACAHLETLQGENAPLPSCRRISLSIPCVKRAIILAEEKEWGPEALVLGVHECERRRNAMRCTVQVRGVLTEWGAENGMATETPKAAVESSPVTWPMEATARLLHGVLRVRSRF